jgi:hypothetical protein
MPLRAATTGMSVRDNGSCPTPAQGEAANCFPASTPIATPRGILPIAEIRVGDMVWSYDPYCGKGRGELTLKRVVRLYAGMTEQWVRVLWREDRQERELIATPGHHFLDRFGRFPKISAMMSDAASILVLENGATARFKVEGIVYGEATAGMFERAEMSIAANEGGLALKPILRHGWKTYNFEVEEFHTYVAGGVRAHNMSGPPGQSFLRVPAEG